MYIIFIINIDKIVTRDIEGQYTKNIIIFEFPVQV